jgi:hypothetical protein
MPTLFWPFPSRERYHRARSHETSTEELLSPITGFPSLQEIKADDHEYLYKHNSRILLRWKVIAIASSSLSLDLLGLLLFLFHLLAQRYFRLGTPGIYCKSRSDPRLIDFRKLTFDIAPAQAAVEYELVVFHNNFWEDRTPYQGPPNDAVDAAWSELYDGIPCRLLPVLEETILTITIGVGIIAIDGHSASLLPNETLPIPGDDQDRYIVGLEVFHQLHCLVLNDPRP